MTPAARDGMVASWDPVQVRHASASDVGRVRTINEDSVLTAPPIYLVADGMGGHDAGEVASAIAVEEFGRLSGRRDLQIDELGTALGEARQRIEALGAEGPLSAGTTVALVATMTVDDVAYWVVLNLGDSRVYRLSDELFEQVSVDHSVVQELVDKGELTAGEARVHPYRHMITRALGAGPASDPDYWLIPAEDGDRILICSDGLSGEVPDEVIERTLREAASPREACAALVDLALAAGGHDNVSVVVLEARVVSETDADEDTAPSGVRDDPEPEIEEDTVPRAVPSQISEDGAGGDTP